MELAGRAGLDALGGSSGEQFDLWQSVAAVQIVFFAGTTDVRDCQACGGPHDGTVGHRLFHCRTLSHLREQYLASPLVHEARQGLLANPEHPLWTRGLLPLSALPKVKAVEPK